MRMSGTCISVIELKVLASMSYSLLNSAILQASVKYCGYIRANSVITHGHHHIDPYLLTRCDYHNINS
jgi:hypothetical protein